MRAGAAGDGEVLQAAVNEGQDFVAALGRLDMDRAVADEGAQLAGIAGQAEKQFSSATRSGTVP